MKNFKKYTSEELKNILIQYPFFIPAKIELESRGELEDKSLDLLRRLGVVELGAKMSISPSEFAQRSVNSIIDSFLSVGDYRIKPNDSAHDQDLTQSENPFDDQELISEELAEILLSQGLKEQAKQMYLKLSLLNPKKSVYFARIISELENTK